MIGKEKKVSAKSGLGSSFGSSLKSWVKARMLILNKTVQVIVKAYQMFRSNSGKIKDSDKNLPLREH